VASTRLLTERRQLYQILSGHRLQRLSGLTPGSEAADQNKGAESLLSQHVRHPGARCFAHSSAVEVDVLFFGQSRDFFFEVVRFNADGALDTHGLWVVVAVTAYVCDKNPRRLLGCEFLD